MFEQYAFDPRERAQVGVRSREWTAVAATELEDIRELARCFRVIREGRVPEIMPRGFALWIATALLAAGQDHDRFGSGRPFLRPAHDRAGRPSTGPGCAEPDGIFGRLPAVVSARGG